MNGQRMSTLARRPETEPMEVPYPRVVGRYRGEPGPKLIVLGGIHGNEPAGIVAVRKVLARLEAERPTFRGELVGLSGNTRALGRGARYVDKDLNRVFTPERVAFIRSSRPEERVESEDQEMFELLHTVEEELGSAKGDAYFLDLHTTSAEGVPFVLFGDTLRNRKFALQIPLPVILGLEEQLDGTLLEYVNSQGYVTLGCEGGQHRSEGAAGNHEALIWLALVNAGLLEAEPRYVDAPIERLRAARGNLPRVIEVRYRHAITAKDQFVMQPGFTNFDKVASGKLLARDVKGEVRARWSGWLLMPLYQGQGNDGFFLATEVHGLWLGVSEALRRLRLTGLLRLLPGVARHRDRRDSLVVDTRIARWFPLEVFRLFGFRKLRWQGPVLVMSRRPYDLSPPR